jgi:chloramphenicol O-acetyltransferase type B
MLVLHAILKVLIYIKRIKSLVSRVIYTYIVKKRAESVGRHLTVNNRSRVTKRTILGNNVHFNGIEIMGTGRLIIGDNFHSGKGCIILTSIHNYDGGCKLPYDETVIESEVIIGDNVWFGVNVTILPGVIIGEGAIVQAGSVVTKNVPDCAIAGGHPANVFKYRNKEHYYSLKEAGKFF